MQNQSPLESEPPKDRVRFCNYTKSIYLEPTRPDPYRRVLPSDDQYWSGYFDGVNCQSRIDVWVYCGVSLLMFLIGLAVGLRWHGV